MGGRSVCMLVMILAGVMQSPAAGQSLADVARQEAARRQQIKAPKKVLTNADLPASAVRVPDRAAAPEGEAESQVSEAADPSAPVSPASTAPAARKDDEAAWRGRAETVNGALTAARAKVRQLKALSDQLALEMQATNAAAAARAAAERVDVTDQLARAQSEADDAFAARHTLELEARQSGVPPPWIQ